MEVEVDKCPSKILEKLSKEKSIENPLIAQTFPLL
jgi:hypothetical protein